MRAIRTSARACPCALHFSSPSPPCALHFSSPSPPCALHFSSPSPFCLCLSRCESAYCSCVCACVYICSCPSASLSLSAYLPLCHRSVCLCATHIPIPHISAPHAPHTQPPHATTPDVFFVSLPPPLPPPPPRSPPSLPLPPSPTHHESADAYGSARKSRDQTRSHDGLPAACRCSATPAACPHSPIAPMSNLATVPVSRIFEFLQARGRSCIDEINLQNS